MESYDFNPKDLINARERFIVPSKVEPAIDETISKIVGKKIYTQDPRLIKLIVKWKRGKSQDSMEPDSFLDDPRKVGELKSVLEKDL